MYLNDVQWIALLAAHPHTGTDWVRMRLTRNGKGCSAVLHRDPQGLVYLQVKDPHRVSEAEAWRWAAEMLGFFASEKTNLSESD